ncbi:MAG: AMP-dependent synthetase/ligase [Alphaproteobacteria bacterium]
MFFDRAGAMGDAPFVWRKTQGRWQSLSWAETADQVRRLAAGLRRLGVAAGDRVVLVAENRPEWLIADLAIMSIGAITTPAYTTNTSDDHRHILQDSGASAAIVSSARLAHRLLPAAIAAPALGHVIAMEAPGLKQTTGVTIHDWDRIVADGAADADTIADGVRQISRGDTACIIYTSGTGGVPKGVMLSHGAIVSNCSGAFDLLLALGLDDEVFLSFLPLSHSYEHTAGQFFPISICAQIYYAEGIDALSANMVEARPTIMTAVPRLYETMHRRINAAMDRQGGLKKRLFDRALALGRKKFLDPRSLSLSERLTNLVLDRLVRRKVQQRFGGRLKALVSGGAPLNTEIGLFFSALGLRLLQGYGQTETAPVVSCNRPDSVRMESVGPPIQGAEVRIADDGEILVRGELTMQGYWNNPQATAEVLRDGWIHTGDIGRLDDRGRIEITDRKKDIIVNSGGDNVSPQRIEGMLTLQPEIAQAMVYGDRRPHLVALLVPDEEFVAGHGDGDLKAALMEVVGRVNRELSPVERVRAIAVTTDPFTTENGMMTPSLKIRRHAIRQAYGDRLEALYRQS